MRQRFGWSRKAAGSAIGTRASTRRPMRVSSRTPVPMPRLSAGLMPLDEPPVTAIPMSAPGTAVPLRRRAGTRRSASWRPPPGSMRVTRSIW